MAKAKKQNVEKTTKKNKSKEQSKAVRFTAGSSKRKNEAIKSKPRLTVSAVKLSDSLEKRLARQEKIRHELNQNRGGQKSALEWRSPANLLERVSKNCEAYKSTDELRRELNNLNKKESIGKYAEAERFSVEQFSEPTENKHAWGVVGGLGLVVLECVRQRERGKKIRGLGGVLRGSQTLRHLGDFVDFSNRSDVATNGERYILPAELWARIKGKQRKHITDLMAILRAVETDKRNTHIYPSVAFLESLGFSEDMIRRAVALGCVGRYRYIFRHNTVEDIMRSAFYGLKLGSSLRVDMRTTSAYPDFMRQIKSEIGEVRKRQGGRDTYGEYAEVGTVGY